LATTFLFPVFDSMYVIYHYFSTYIRDLDLKRMPNQPEKEGWMVSVSQARPKKEGLLGQQVGQQSKPGRGGSGWLNHLEKEGGC
jgi:hypothetical protein